MHSSILIIAASTVPLNYNFTFTRVSGLATRVVRVESAKSYSGTLRFHVKGRSFSTRSLVAFHDTWNFHETRRGISTRPVAMEFPRDQSPWNLAWNFHKTSSRGA